MPEKASPRIRRIAADEKSMILRIRRDKGEQNRVDASGLVETFRVH